MKKKYHLTKDGRQALEDEMATLIARRGSLAQAIASAREQGDISENAEFTNAKLDQERVESRISEIDHILKNADEIKISGKKDKVRLGVKVELSGVSSSKTVTYSVVGTVEANPAQGKVSDESPIGKSLMGKALGEKVEIVTPATTTEYKIVSIS